MSFFPMLYKELLGHLRTYRFLVLIIVFIIVGIISPLTDKFMPELFKLIPTEEQIMISLPPPSIRGAVIQFTGNMSQFGIILALLLTMGTVSKEKDKGTASMVLDKSISRFSFLLAKLVGLFIIFTIGTLCAMLASLYYTFVLYGEINILNWILSSCLLLFFFYIYITITLFCSTLSKSVGISIGISAGFLILFSALGAIPAFKEYFPGYLVNWATEVAINKIQFYSCFWTGIGIIILFLFGAWIVFRKQEI